MNFKPVEVSDYAILKGFFAEQPYSLSIYSPASIIAWSNRIYRTRYAISGETLFISGEQADRPDERHLILPLSPKIVHSPALLHRLARQFGFARYAHVPGDLLETLDRSGLDAFFIPMEQKEFEDYVYRTEDLVHLRGNRYAKKRNLIHQFSREYLYRNRVEIQAIRPEHVGECLEFLELWCERHACDVDQELDLACEKSALTTTLCNLNILESSGILIRIDGRVSALGIGSRLNGTTATLNFEKAFSEIKGLYQFLDNECAKRLFGDYRFINKESDMNLPNLADSKQSYHPVFRVKSYRLELR